MKKSLLTIFVLSLIILTGCTAKNSNPDTAGQEENLSSTTTVEQNSLTAEDSSVNNSLSGAQEIKKYYPEPLASQVDEVKKKTATPESPMPENLQIKGYLVEKYNPGICYGMPAPVREEDINGMISRNQAFAEYVKNRYKLKTNLEVYMKIKQYFGIQLKSISGGKFQYNFVDGQCCTLKAFEGQIENLGGKISENLTNQETKNNPC